jgi:hypothetical protein
VPVKEIPATAPAAYSFESALGIFQILSRLRQEGSWTWRPNDGEAGFYLSARPGGGVRLRVIEEGENRFLFVVGAWPEALPLHAVVLDKILPLLEARNVRPAGSPD